MHSLSLAEICASANEKPEQISKVSGSSKKFFSLSNNDENGADCVWSYLICDGYTIVDPVSVLLRTISPLSLLDHPIDPCSFHMRTHRFGRSLFEMLEGSKKGVFEPEKPSKYGVLTRSIASSKSKS